MPKSERKRRAKRREVNMCKACCLKKYGLVDGICKRCRAMLVMTPY